MKIKVLNYFTLNKLKPNQKNILDIKILDQDESILVNKKFTNKEKNLTFTVKSIGHINPPVENYFPLVVEIDEAHELKDYKDLIFIESI
jgi:hypothetical protein